MCMTKKRVKLVLLFVLNMLLCFGVLLGCKSESAVKTTYTITVMSEGEKSLSGIKVYVYKDSKQEDLVWVAETDKDGEVTFDAEESDAYVAVLKDVPKGYLTEESYFIKGTQTQIKLAITLEGDSADVVYKLGDVVHDFEVTATNGTTYKLSELLNTKKAVILNFWFLNCGPCKMEFPYLQEAYDEYKDSLEVIAINPLDGTNDKIIAYAQENVLTLPMVAGEIEWQNMFTLTAYPTTVVIDCYGTIAMMHQGSITDEDTFTKIFAYFTSDTYEQTTIRNISDIE